MEWCLEDDEFECYVAGAKLVERLSLEAYGFFLTVLAAHLCRWVFEEVAVTHLHKLNLVFLGQINDFQQVHHTMFQVRYLETHQIVKTPRLHHVFEVFGHLDDFWVPFIHAHVIEQVIKNIADHLNLLLLLQIVVNLTCSLVTHDLFSSLCLHSLQICQNWCDSASEIIEALVKLSLLLRIETHWLWWPSAVRLISWELLISSSWLSLVLGLVHLLRTMCLESLIILLRWSSRSLLIWIALVAAKGGFLPMITARSSTLVVTTLASRIPRLWAWLATSWLWWQESWIVQTIWWCQSLGLRWLQLAWSLREVRVLERLRVCHIKSWLGFSCFICAYTSFDPKLEWIALHIIRELSINIRRSPNQIVLYWDLISDVANQINILILYLTFLVQGWHKNLPSNGMEDLARYRAYR